MEERSEFVRLALLPGANRRELCRRFGISATVGYKWLRRFGEGGDAGLAERSRRPLSSPGRTADAVEARVLAVRDEHPAWGARKIARRLEMDGLAPPAVSTVHAVLQRHGRIAPEGGGRAWQRFETEAPNRLWQMDFKGWESLADGRRCHPLTVIDDHSRYAVCLEACADQRTETVQGRLEAVFRRHGLPDALFVDNGSPWSDPSRRKLTRLSVWLMKLGVAVLRSRPRHPQSRGKNERFHRTLKAEVFALRRFAGLAEAQCAFDLWRNVYNRDRPHEAIGLDVPASRYRPSPRPMPRELPGIVYDAGEITRRVGTTKSYIRFRQHLCKVPQALRGETVAIRPTATDGVWRICFGSHQIGTIDLTPPQHVSDVPEQASTISPV